EERLLRAGDDDARDRLLLGLEALDGLADRRAVVGVHGVRRLVRVVEDQRDDAVVVLLPANGVAPRGIRPRVLMATFGLRPLVTVRLRLTHHLDRLHHGRDAHAAADAQRGEAVPPAGPVQLVDERAEDHAAG